MCSPPYAELNDNNGKRKRMEFNMHPHQPHQPGVAGVDLRQPHQPGVAGVYLGQLKLGHHMPS